MASDAHMAPAALAPIIQSVLVNLPVEAAFRLFTEGVGTWWPLNTHSVYGDEAAACRLEGRVGGRFYETHADGRESEWGRVLVWEPPHRVVMAWYPGWTPAEATEVEFAFTPEAGGTRLTLTHRGWEKAPANVHARRANYDSGWPPVLDMYVARAAGAQDGEG